MRNWDILADQESQLEPSKARMASKLFLKNILIEAVKRIISDDQCEAKSKIMPESSDHHHGHHLW